MQKVLFEFKDYGDYLADALPVSGEGRGSRNRLAEALNCNKGFISQVFGGNAHFSLEHAARISRFLNHDLTEREFFLLLVHLGRSGSKDLNEFYQSRLDEILEKRKQIKQRIVAAQLKGTASAQLKWTMRDPVMMGKKYPLRTVPMTAHNG